MSTQNIETRENYYWFTQISTRWSDNDVYGHVNNVVYYSYFDTAVNEFLIHEGGLNIRESDVIAYVVNSTCNYHSAVSYPEKIDVGIRVEHSGNSSVRYGISVFRAGENIPSASGSFVHVFVNRLTGKPVPIPQNTRDTFRQITGS